MVISMAQELEQDKNWCLNTNSFIPALNESERFISFLNQKFNLNLTADYVITINKAGKNIAGYFMPKEHAEHFKNTKQDLHNININTYHLKTENPYGVLAHELAHYINHGLKVKDTTKNQYHNKHFKEKAELLLLKVERTNKGYSKTEITEQFSLMLNEFKPNQDAFNICQNMPKKDKVGSRLRLFICDCGVKVRCAVDLHALCLNCESEFKESD